jgi:hypothetical protein
MTRTLPGLALLVALAGCAPRAPSSAAPGEWHEIVTVNDRGEATVCQRERPTGSHISEMVCYRREDLDRDRARAQTQDALRKLTPSVPNAKGQ